MRTTSKLAVSRLMPPVLLGLLVLGFGQRGSGEIVTPGQRELGKAERKLQAARARVTATAEYLSAAQGLRMARLAVFRASQTAQGAGDRVRKESEIAEILAHTEAVEAEQLARDATNALERRRSAMNPARDHFLSRPLLAYDIAQHGKLTFNTVTGAFDLSLDGGPGARLKPAELDALLAGRLQLPDAKPLQLASETHSPRERHTSNYSAVLARLVAEHGAGNVYLLSRRFLDWASAERLAADFAGASVKSGLSLVSERTLAQRHVQLEFEDLAAWLRLKGVKDFGPDPAAIVAELIRTGSYSRLGLSVKTTTVEYTIEPERGGQTEVPVDYLKRLRPHKPPGQSPPRLRTEKRPALAIIWSGPPTGEESLTPYLDGNFRLSPPAITDLPKLLPAHTDSRIRRLLTETVRSGLPEIDASTTSRRVARAAIGLRKEDLETSATASSMTVDLRSSDFGEIIAAFVSQLAMGNQKSCDVSVLELDKATGRLEAEFTLHHRHTWANLREVRAELTAAYGAVGTDVEDLADHLPDATFDNVRKLYHEADVRAHEAGKHAYEAEQKVHEATDRIAAKRNEVAILASEVVRAQADLQIAADREALARQEAQTACIQMLQLEGQVRMARNRARGLERPSATSSVISGRLESGKRW
jgi:hypothetical protein